jgi:hypothetical protein
MSQSPQQSALETTVRLMGMTLVFAPLINLTWLPYMQPEINTGTYWAALLIGIPYVFIAWIWGYGLRRFYENKPKYINRPRGFY